MFHYHIINKPKFKVQKKTIDSIFTYVEKYISTIQNGRINIVFVDDSTMQNLNAQYRNINKVTDVLSFHYFSDFHSLKKKDTAGEIILSETKIKIQAEEYGLGEEHEFYKLVIHSLLHILGYDHEEENDYEIMQALENKIWNEVFEK